MGAPRRGLNPTTNSVGFTAKLVTVRSVSADGATAVVVDRQNTQTQVPMLVQRSKGPLPAPGDAWLISQDLGMWSFAAFVGTSGSDFAGGGQAGSQVTIGPDPPLSPVAGDIWLDSSDGNQVSSWDGAAWVPAQFGAAALAPASVTAAQMALATITSRQIAADAGILASQVAFTAAQIGGSRVFTGTSQPAGMQPGDLWFNAASGNMVSVWTGGGWDPLLFSAPAILEGSLTGAQLSEEASIAASQVNFTSSDIGGITVTISASEPAGPAEGDLWYDSENGYVLEQWNGSEWAVYQYGTQAIAARSVTAELIAANTITTAELAAGLVYAGIIDGTIVEAATFIGSVFEGTDFVLNTAGAFWYDGSGNLILSIAPASTSTDGLGHTVYGGGLAAYSSTTAGVSVQLGALGLYFEDVPAGIATAFNMVGGQLVVSGTGMGQSTVTFAIPITATGGTASSPTKITTDTWHTPGSLPTGWSGTLRYKLMPDNTVMVHCQCAIGTSAATGTITLFSGLTSAYQPSVAAHGPVGYFSNGGTTAAEAIANANMRWSVNTGASWSIELLGMTGGAAGSGVTEISFVAIYPLD
jgi:hypothetical protein